MSYNEIASKNIITGGPSCIIFFAEMAEGNNRNCDPYMSIDCSPVIEPCVSGREARVIDPALDRRSKARGIDLS